MSGDRYNRPEKGTRDWHRPLNENFEALDRDVEIRDEAANREEYEPKPGAKFLATDTGRAFIGDGEAWNELATTGPDPRFDDVRTERARFRERASFGYDLEDHFAGIALGRTHHTQANRIHEAISRHPVGKTKPTICLSTENGGKAVIEELFPRMRDRGLPFGVWTNPHRILEDDDYVDMDDVGTLIAHGAEVGLYTGIPGESGDGGNLEDVEHLRELERKLLGQKRRMEELGIPVSFISPNSRDGVDLGALDSARSRLIRSAFAASTHGYQRWSGNQFKKTTDPHGLSTRNIGDPDYPSAESVIDGIDELVGNPVRHGIWWHNWAIDGEDGGWDRFEAIVDHIVDLRDRGLVHVASPTGCYHIPWDLPEGNVLTNSDASHSEEFTDGFWSSIGGEPEIRTGGGHAGDNYWALGSDVTNSSVSGMREWRIPVNPAFANAMIRFHARAPEGAGSARLFTRNTGFVHEDFSGVNEVTHEVGESWEPVYRPIGWPRNDVGEGSGHEIAIFTDDREVHVDDLRIYPI